MLITDLSTPSILIDRSRLTRNLQEMQDRATQNNVRLRPHTKTHKSLAIATLQREMGASGLTVAKLGEAEIYAEAGFKDIRLAYTLVGSDKYERLASLSEHCQVSFCVDTARGATAASEFFTAKSLTADVLIETDVGYGRCGVRFDLAKSAEFGKWVDELPGLRVVGILTHAGHSYNGPQNESESNEEALRRVSDSERDHMLEFAVELRNAGVAAASDGTLEITVGSTPSMRYFSNRNYKGFTITEIRPGNYVFLDMIQVQLGVHTLDRCALTVYASVISKHRNADGSERLFLDSGKKVLTSDRAGSSEGFGQILYDAREMVPMPHAVIHAVSEEHGWVRVPGGSTLNVNDRVQIVPNHACVVVNTQRQMFVVEGDEVVETIFVDAQSRVV